jgi:hypothetical protein
MFVLWVWSGFKASPRCVVACYAKVSNKFLGTIIWPTGNPHEVVTRLQQEGAKLLPNDECCYSFMGVFINQQELTSREFINRGDDDDLPDRLAHAQQSQQVVHDKSGEQARQGVTCNQVNQVHFMWADQRCRDSRKGVRYSFNEKTNVLRVQPYMSHQLAEFTKFDFKTPTPGLSVTHASHTLLYFDLLQVLHIDSEIDGMFSYLFCLPNLRVLFGQVLRWKKQDVANLANLTRLETLSASGSNFQVWRLVNKISQLKSLKHVELQTSISYKHYKHKSSFGELHLLSNLVDLRLRASLFQATADLLKLALLRNLETLHLLGDENTSLALLGGDKAFQKPLQHFKNLKHLQIGATTSKWPGLVGLEPNPNSFKELYLRVT